MQPQDIQNLYPVTPVIHSSISRTLASLEDGEIIRYKKHRGVRRLAVAFAAVAVLAAFTSAAYATNLFGLFSERVGKYGLNLSVVGETAQPTDTEKKHVKLKLGYIPEGYEPVTTEDGFTEPYKYTYGGEPITDRWGFSFLIYDADSYDRTETGIIKSSEETVNGRKIVFMTQKTDYDDEPQYLAAAYFDAWGTVVVGYSANETELRKIMEHLDLEEDTGYIEPPTADDGYYDKTEDYTFLGFREEYRFVGIGESFDYSETVYSENGAAVPRDFTVRVKAAEERDRFDGLDRDAFRYVFSNYFDEDNRLITPYSRRDQENGDGINDLTRTWTTEASRRFIVVTVEVTADRDMEYFNGFLTNGRAIERQADGGYDYPDSHGDTNLVYIENADYADGRWEQGETRTFIYGLMADDEVFSESCLCFESRQVFVDDSAETAEVVNDYTCIMLKEAVQDD